LNQQRCCLLPDTYGRPRHIREVAFPACIEFSRARILRHMSRFSNNPNQITKTWLKGNIDDARKRLTTFPRVGSQLRVDGPFHGSHARSLQIPVLHRDSVICFTGPLGGGGVEHQYYVFPTVVPPTLSGFKSGTVEESILRGSWKSVCENMDILCPDVHHVR
jgi:hypothetical protein